ncbi:MAG: outer membrane protein transport protein [Gammaproteobacteria bacterium]
MNINIIKLATVTALVSTVSVAYATNGDQMLGVTATQWGMAGAAVAAPQDSGTIMTNPAGLSLLNIEDVRFDMGIGFLNPPRKANGVESDSDLYMIPSGSVAFKIDEQLTFAMGMAGLSGMGVDFADVTPAPGNQNVVTTKQFFKVAPGFSYQISDKLALGAALNIDYQSLALDMDMSAVGGPTLHLPQNQVYGFGLTLGAIYKISDELQFGASYISKQSMSDFKWNTSTGAYSMNMDAPEIFSMGIAYQPGDDLLVEVDIKYIGFSDVLDVVVLSTPAGDMPMTFGWDDQLVFALGVQKKISEKTTIRAGLNYGESPIGREDVNSNLGSLAITETHASIGATRKLGKNVEGSISYVRAFSNELTSDTTPTTIELDQNVLNFQISYKM